jgi:hypothetical protein
LSVPILIVFGFIELGLFQNAIQRSWGDVIVRMTCNGYSTPFGSMSILPVAAFGRNQKPAILFDQSDELTDFHRSSPTRRISGADTSPVYS